jgi:hypothetical protein
MKRKKKPENKRAERNALGPICCCVEEKKRKEQEEGIANSK